MTREFSDELLSAFLDNELSSAERDQVEKHLAASEADRQLLTELKALRQDVAALPKVAVSPDFTDRVVRAVIAETEKHRSADTTASLPPRNARRWWMFAATVASAAALAAALLLVVQPWHSSGRQSPGLVVTVDPGNVAEQVAAASTDFLQTLRSAVPTEGSEAVVLRIRVAKDVPLADAIDAALAKAGINSLAANLPSRALRWQDAYLKSLENKQAENSASAAVFIEAPLSNIEQVFSNLSTSVQQPWQLAADGRLALDPAAQRSQGEGTSRQPFAQRLNAALFRLDKTLVPATNSATGTPSAEQFVRILLFVESE